MASKRGLSVGAETWAEQTKRAHGFKLPLMPLPALLLGCQQLNMSMKNQGSA